MSLLTAAEIADLQAEHDGGHKDTCRLYATVGTTDAYNADTASWPAITATTACTVLDGDGAVAGTGGIVEILPNNRSKTIVFPRSLIAQGIRILAGWRVAWVEGGITYAIDDVREPGSYGPNVYCQCAEV